MIELRHQIERGLRHPVVGPLLLVLLAVVMVFTAIHGAHDQMHSDELIVCVAFVVLMALVSLVRPRLRPVLLAAPRWARGPPQLPQQPFHRSTLVSAFTPLRL